MAPIVQRDNFVYGEFHEPYHYLRTLEYMKEAAQICQQNCCTRAMMDIRGVTGTISTWDCFKLAQATLRLFGPEVRLVVVYRQEEIDGFFENVVVNRGGTFRIFAERGPACAWLGVEESAVVE